MKKISGHNKFTKYLSQENIKIIERERSNKAFKEAFIESSENQRKELSIKENSIVTAFQLMMEILGKLDELEYAEIFIKSYPRKKTLDKILIRSDYIRYHLEIYYMNIIGLFDRCLILTNYVYGLGLKTRYINYGIITSNEHLMGTETKEILKDFYKALEKKRSLRNYIVHESNLADPELKDVHLYEFLLKNSHSMGNSIRQNMELYIKLEYSKYIKNKKREIKKNNKFLEDITDLFLESLLTEYKKKVKSIK